MAWEWQFAIGQRGEAPRAVTVHDDGAGVRVGRLIDADISLRAGNVAKFHCRCWVDEHGQPYVEDENSTNGTYVNGHKISRHALRDDDKIYVGDFILCFHRIVDA